jgi:hypothetical protein
MRSGDRPKTKQKREQGSIVVLTALALVALLGLVALGVDAALLLVHKQRLGNAVDAGALAGVQELPRSAVDAYLRAVQYGGLNGLSEDEMTVEVSAPKGEVMVRAQRLVDLFFAPLLGIRQATVSARARAHTGAVFGVGGIVPLSVHEGEFVFGERYYLKEGAQPPEGDEEHYGVLWGNFGCLALGGTGADNYRQTLKQGYPKVLRVGDVVNTEPGNMANPTVEAVAWRTEGPAARSCTFESLRPDCPQRVIVPVVDLYQTGGRGPVAIKGFAAFFLEGTKRNGAQNYVIGRFVRWVVDGEVGDAHDFGLRAFRLVE